MGQEIITFAWRLIKGLGRRSQQPQDDLVPRHLGGALINETKGDRLILLYLVPLDFSTESPTSQENPQTQINRDVGHPTAKFSIIRYLQSITFMKESALLCAFPWTKHITWTHMDTPGFHNIEITRSFHWEQQRCIWPRVIQFTMAGKLYISRSNREGVRRKHGKSLRALTSTCHGVPGYQSPASFTRVQILVLELKGTTENIWFNPVFGLVRCDYHCFKGEASKAQAGGSLGCS